MFNKMKKFFFKDIKKKLDNIENFLKKIESVNNILCDKMSEIVIENQNLKKKIEILENNRTELFDRLDILEDYTHKLDAEKQSYKEKIEILEKDRNEIFKRLDSLINNNLLCIHDSIEILEKDRNKLFERIDKIYFCIHDLQTKNQVFLDKIETLEKDRNELFQRTDKNKKILRDCGFLNIKSRIDSRIIRLEILEYYSDLKKYITLNQKQKDIIEYLKNDYDYELSTGRTYYEDEFYKPNEYEIPCQMYKQGNLWFNYINGNKVFWGENENDAKEYYKETIYWLEKDTPHRYVDVEKDGIDVPDNAILLDIGAAEGYFGLKYLNRCKKVYFFECDEKWISYLKEATADFSNKVEIIKGFVGDKEDDIKIDEFFKYKEKPTVIKMDIEGAEGAVLRGMTNLINDDNIPLTMFICTYHRQDDWDRYYNILKDHFRISCSNGYYWNMQDPKPPFFRIGMMRAERKVDFKEKI